MDASTCSMLESRSKAQVQACMGCHYAAALRRLHRRFWPVLCLLRLWQMDNFSCFWRRGEKACAADRSSRMTRPLPPISIRDSLHLCCQQGSSSPLSCCPPQAEINSSLQEQVALLSEQKALAEGLAQACSAEAKKLGTKVGSRCGERHSAVWGGRDAQAAAAVGPACSVYWRYLMFSV